MKALLDVPFDCNQTKAFKRGVADKEFDIEEPKPPYYPGSSDYRDYAIGYLSTDWPETR